VLIDEELHSFFNAEAREMSAFLYGRPLYELMVDCWPTAEADPSATPAMLEFARTWRDKPKLVFSRTLPHVEWNSRLVRLDVVGEVACLRAEPGFDMSVGGPALASSVMRAGLIDEYRLCVHPVILGPARRTSRRWRIASDCGCSRHGPSAPGVVYLRYVPVSPTG
jgi:dihydrofolate reductase